MPRTRTQSAETVPDPRIDVVIPAAALPLGEIELTGANLGPNAAGLPVVLVDGQIAQVLMSRPDRIAVRVPEDAATGLISVRSHSHTSNTVSLSVAHQLSEGLHPVTSPAVSRSGMIYATISGPPRQADPGLNRPGQPRWPRHSFRHRHPERHRPGFQSRRRPLCHLARRGQRLPRRRQWRGLALCRGHGRGHRRGF